MSGLATSYERNAAFAETFDQGDLPIKASLGLVILACMDARVGPEITGGVELGDAFVLRTAGARVTEAVALELAMVWKLMTMTSGSAPDLELVIIQHTQCGMARFAVPEVAEAVTAHFGTEAVVDTYAIADQEESLLGDIERLRSNPVVPRLLKVSGHVYDIAAGRMREVEPTQTLG